jgi:divalent metal cation (Fe/Co/Zn/Cd) transporter
VAFTTRPSSEYFVEPPNRRLAQSKNLVLKVDGTLSIKEAHTIASTIEAAIRTELGEEVLIESHLDPRLTDLVDALLERVHDTVDRLEHRLYEQLPEAQRIIIHAEPARHVD